MAKVRFKPILVFVSNDSEASQLAASTPNHRVINSTTGPLAFRRAMVEQANGEYETLIATPQWSTGWRAPIGTEVWFSDSFPAELKAQAMARVPGL